MSAMGQLRPIQDDEVEQMRAWRNAPEVRIHMYTKHEISQAEHLAWWAQVRARADMQYFMFEGAGEPLGIVCFTHIDRANANCSWAFYAAPQARKGTGAHMEFLALEHAFNTLDLHKLHCEVLASNALVIRLHQKFGFQVEGVLRQHHRANDEYVDIYKLGLLKEEWANKRDGMQKKIGSSCFLIWNIKS